MDHFRVGGVALAALGFGAAATGAAGEPQGHRFQFVATRISYKQLDSTPSGASYGIDGVAFVANATDGTIYRCTGRIVLRQTDPNKTAADSLKIDAAPLQCHAMTYEKPAPDPLDGDLVFAPDQSKSDDERAYLSFFRLSQTFASIAFCTTVDEKRIRCTPQTTLP